MLVDMTVDELAGVSEVRTDHVSGQTVVTYDDQETNTETIVKAIRSAGYDAELVSL